ncbi:Orn/Lys/Arg decarboxylase N-terminal domain-containing protein [Streptomyces hygroscopicus]
MADSRVLMAVPEHPRAEGARAEQLRKIRDAVEAGGFEVRWAVDAQDADAVLRTEAGLAAALVAWDLPGGGVEDGGPVVLRRIGRRFRDLPVFLIMTEEGSAICRCGCRRRSSDTCGRWRTLRDSSRAASPVPPGPTGRTCCRRSSGRCAASTTPTSTPGTPRRTPAVSPS